MAQLERTTPTQVDSTGSPCLTATEIATLNNNWLVGAAVITPLATVTKLDFNLVIPSASAITPAAGTLFGLYFLPKVDGTNFPYPPNGSAAIPDEFFAGVYDFNGSAVKVLQVLNLKCPDYPFMVGVQYTGAVAFPAGCVASLWGNTWQWV